MDNYILRHLIFSALIFTAFYAVPFMAEYVVQKYRIRIIGWELILIVGPIIFIAALFTKEWELAIFSLMASLGSHLSFYKVSKKISFTKEFTEMTHSH